MPIPAEPKIYHITHVENLRSIISDGWLWCDFEVGRRSLPGTTIGMGGIKQRRLTELTLSCHPGLHVGDFVPFYFCPRSIMLYMIHKGNTELTYRGGQEPIVHLEANLRQTVEWAENQKLRWAFTLSNAGAYGFEDRCNLAQLGEINWDSVQNNGWGYAGVDPSVRHEKQAEFLLERCFPWQLVQRIGVYSRPIYDKVHAAMAQTAHQPKAEFTTAWYY